MPFKPPDRAALPICRTQPVLARRRHISYLAHMKPFSRLKYRLLAIILLATLPLLAVVADGYRRERAAAIVAVDENIRAMLRTTLLKESEIVDSIQLTLRIMSNANDMNNLDPDSCTGLAQRLMKAQPFFANLGAVLPNGDAFCSARAMTQVVNVSDREWFKELLATQKFTAGFYQVGRISGERGVGYGYPLLDANGNLRAALFVSVRLDWFERVVEQAQMPAGWHALIVTRDGHIAAHFPANLPNHHDNSADILRLLGDLPSKPGVRYHTIGETEHLTGIAPLVSTTDALYLMIGSDTVEILAPIEQRYRYQIALALGISLGSILLAWFAIHGSLIGWFTRMNVVLRRFGDGDLSIRAGRISNVSELQDLTCQFDAMATQIETADRQSKLQHAALDEARRLLRTVIDASPVVIYAFDTEGHCILANRRIAELIGVKPEDMLGKLREEIMTAAIAGQHRANDILVSADGRIRTLEETNVEADGQHTYLSVKFPLRDAGDRIYAVGGISIDITAERQAQQALRESEARYRHTLDTLLEGCQFVNRDWRYRYINAAAERHNRRPAAELLGRTMMECWPGITATAVYTLEQRCMDERSSQQAEIEFAFPDGSTGWFRVIVQPSPDGIVVFSEEITARKLAEHEVRQLNAGLELKVAARTRELQAANSELEAFAYSVSHDLRAPLRAIAGFSEILNESHRSALDATGQHYLDNVKNAAAQMNLLIDELLQFTRIGRGVIKVAPVPLAPLLTEIETLFQPRLVSGGRLEIATPLATPVGDSRLIRQILTNLIDNAFKYQLPGNLPVIRIGAQQEDGTVMIAVADNGIGIAPEYQRMIFQVFQRLHDETQYPGSGIGLAIAQKAARLMDGTLTVESGPGGGSTFILRLPAESRPSE